MLCEVLLSFRIYIFFWTALRNIWCTKVKALTHQTGQTWAYGNRKCPWEQPKSPQLYLSSSMTLSLKQRDKNWNCHSCNNAGCICVQRVRRVTWSASHQPQPSLDQHVTVSCSYAWKFSTQCKHTCLTLACHSSHSHNHISIPSALHA
jgi:hypothetical protein